MKDKIIIISTVFIVCIFICILTVCLVGYGEQCAEYEYQLTEIQDGIYGTYSTVVSSIPAQNYDMITLCCDGQIKTFKGTIHISYTDSNPYVIHKDTNYNNADELYVYVPFGTIEYEGATGIGSRR